MILSFHPIIEADRNIICAGREPDAADLEAIRSADAVILPQGCREALYRMARENCGHIFPNLDVRFDYPGKRGQIQLFDQYGLEHPETQAFDSTELYHRMRPKIELPAVVKFDWGGQGDTVFKVTDASELASVMHKAKAHEATGQYGFLVQSFIDAGHRSLRIVVIGTRLISYWRIQPPNAPFGAGVAEDTTIDHQTDPALQKAAVDVTARLCGETGLQLAGFDFIFDEVGTHARPGVPLALEINYFFGRTGLGGSDRYYALLSGEVGKWLSTVGLR